MLNKGGPRAVFITGSVLILVGNWIRYAGTRADNGIFGVVMFGQLLLGLAQPFALAAPTRYSDLWFSENGRTSATALATLANPLGAAIGELVDSAWTTEPGDIPNMVLYISIIVRLSSPLQFLELVVRTDLILRPCSQLSPASHHSSSQHDLQHHPALQPKSPRPPSSNPSRAFSAFASSGSCSSPSPSTSASSTASPP